MTRARLRRGARKRRAAREAAERKARGVWAFSVLPLPLELREGPDPAGTHGGEPGEASFSGDGRDVDIIRVCEACNGFARRCKHCRRFHLARAGRGGEGSMPWRVSEEWLQEHGCPRGEFGEVPIPFVWTPDGDGPPEFDVATYGAIDGEPGRYELQCSVDRGRAGPEAHTARVYAAHRITLAELACGHGDVRSAAQPRKRLAHQPSSDVKNARAWPPGRTGAARKHPHIDGGGGQRRTGDAPASV